MDPKEAQVYNALLTGALVLAVILIYFIFSILSQHRRRVKLQNEKVQAEIITLENERKRMASDLHDELGPLLSAVKMQINSLEVSGEDEDILDKASGHIDSLLQRIREISNDLMPVALVRKGFVTAIQEFADNVTRSGKLKVMVAADTSELNLEKHREIHLYRIAQEVVHNAMKHAAASVVKIDLQQTSKLVSLTIADDGKGFDQDEAMRNGGHGLENIYSRVQILQGDLYVEAKPGKGAKYNIEIPL